MSFPNFCFQSSTFGRQCGDAVDENPSKHQDYYSHSLFYRKPQINLIKRKKRKVQLQMSSLLVLFTFHYVDGHKSKI